MARLITFAWLPASLAEFECHQGFLVRAAYDARRGDTRSPLTVLVLEGFERITRAYAGALRAAGIELLDCAAIAREIERGFASLRPRFGTYETLCFLRWLVAERALAGEAFVHLDADVMLQEPRERLLARLAGCTFTLGGCGIVAVAARDWIAAYRGYLERFAADPEALRRETDDGGAPRRWPIGNDQGLIRHLEANGRLPCTGERASALAGTLWFDDPLEIVPAAGAPPIRWSQRDGVDLLDGTPVLAWHLKNDLCNFLARIGFVRDIMRHDLAREPVAFGDPRLYRVRSAENMAYWRLAGLAGEEARDLAHSGALLPHDRRAVSPTSGIFLRAEVMSRFLLRGDYREAFSDAVWFRKGVFA